jgi:hypothetical protein
MAYLDSHTVQASAREYTANWSIPCFFIQSRDKPYTLDLIALYAFHGHVLPTALESDYVTNLKLFHASSLIFE